MTFDATTNPIVHMKVGLSYVSVANAQLNLQTEDPTGNFAAVRQTASDAWNARLNEIQVQGGSSAEQAVFYTALYHTMFHPNVFSDVNGQYIGFDHTVHTAPAGHAQYENIPGWDNYRSEMRLLALTAPDVAGDIAQSLINDAVQSNGPLPRWEQGNADSLVMVGDPADASIASIYALGATNFDAATALQLMNQGATDPSRTVREGLSSDLALGYVPSSVSGSAAINMEFASDDFSISRFAAALGNSSLASTYLARAQGWRNLFSPLTQYITPRDASGTFLSPFSPTSGTGFVEGDSAQYTWMLPFNYAGLFQLMGGNATAVSRMDVFWAQLNGGTNSPYGFMGNEPSEGSPWAYDFAGAPWRTQDVVRRIETQLFTDSPGGLPGNDDAGALSSWLVFADIGLYPEIPGVGGFVIGSPLFSSVTMNLPSGHTIQINAPAASDANRYVQSLQVNGAPTTSVWLPISTVFAGPTSTLNFALGSAPSMSFGSGPADAPPSFDVPGTTPTIVIAPAANPNPVNGTTTQLSVLGGDAAGESALRYTWSTIAKPAGAPIPLFSVNGTNAAKNTTVTFFAAGTYTFEVTLFNGARSVNGTVSVTVNSVASALSILPNVAAVNPGASQQFSATTVDQFGHTLSAIAGAQWAVSDWLGSITGAGIYTAPNTDGTATITATAGNLSGNLRVHVRPYSDVTAGLVGRWNFDEGSGVIASDSSPAGANPGTLVGPAWTVPGRVGTGDLTFDGASTYVSVNDSASLDMTQAITLAAWINAIDWNGNRRILEKADPNGPNQGDNQYRLTAEGGQLKFQLYGVGTVAAALPSTGQWHHIAGTYDGTTMKLYVDGVVVASLAATGTIATSTAPLTIGTKNTTTTTAGNFFHGQLDDVRVYNRALSAPEIATVLGQPPTGPEISGIFLSGPGWTMVPFSLPGGPQQLTDLPWSNLSNIEIRFTEPVNAGSLRLTLTDSAGNAVPLSAGPIMLSPSDVKFTFARAIAAGRFRLSIGATDTAGNALDGEWTDGSSAFPTGDGAAGSGSAAFQINVLPGDTNHDGSVNFTDLLNLAQHYGQIGAIGEGDLTGDGSVSFDDLLALAQNYGRVLAPAAAAAADLLKSIYRKN